MVNLTILININEPNRIPQLTVFLPPHEGLRPTNRFLDRAAFVFTGQHYNVPHLSYWIANRLASQFGRDPMDFTVVNIEDIFGDLMVLFPNEEMKEQAISVGTCYLSAGVEITLVGQSIDLAMAYEPTTFRARIRIRGVPLQHWNKLDITGIVSGFGYPLKVAPYLVNGNYQFLRVFVACKDPGKIQKNLLLAVEPSGTKIQIELEGWMQVTGE